MNTFEKKSLKPDIETKKRLWGTMKLYLIVMINKIRKKTVTMQKIRDMLFVFCEKIKE